MSSTRPQKIKRGGLGILGTSLIVAGCALFAPQSTPQPTLTQILSRVEHTNVQQMLQDLDHERAPPPRANLSSPVRSFQPSNEQEFVRQKSFALKNPRFVSHEPETTPSLLEDYQTLFAALDTIFPSPTIREQYESHASEWNERVTTFLGIPPITFSFSTQPETIKHLVQKSFSLETPESIKRANHYLSRIHNGNIAATIKTENIYVNPRANHRRAEYTAIHELVHAALNNLQEQDVLRFSSNRLYKRVAHEAIATTLAHRLLFEHRHPGRSENEFLGDVTTAVVTKLPYSSDEALCRRFAYNYFAIAFAETLKDHTTGYTITPQEALSATIDFARHPPREPLLEERCEEYL